MPARLAQFSSSLLLAGALLAQLTPQQERIRESYNITFRDNPDGVFNPQPNRFLAEMVNEIKPGRALDVGMGQGRNALYLAQRGWMVTGVDVSDEGIRQAKAEASKRNLKLETVHSGAESFDFGAAAWDLIVFCYLDPRPYTARIIPALRPGGMIVVEGFHKRTTKTRLTPGWFEDNELLRVFPSLRVLRYEDVLAKQDWGFQMIEPNRLVRYAAVRPGPEEPGCRWEARAYKEGDTVCWGARRWRCDPDGWIRAGDCPK